MGIRKNIVYWGEYKYFSTFSIIFRAIKLVSNCQNSVLLIILIGTGSSKGCVLFHILILSLPWVPSYFMLLVIFTCKIFSCASILCQSLH